MKIIRSDLIAIASDFDAIVHGCNCFCAMGAGIARQIKDIWPEAYQADKDTKKGDKSKLGTYSKADIIIKDKMLTIINAYTQYDYGFKRDVPPVDYDAIRKVFRQINSDFKGKKISIPKIGAGLAGGDWNKIQSIIEQETSDLDMTIVEYNFS